MGDRCRVEIITSEGGAERVAGDCECGSVDPTYFAKPRNEPA